MRGGRMALLLAGALAVSIGAAGAQGVQSGPSPETSMSILNGAIAASGTPATPRATAAPATAATLAFTSTVASRQQSQAKYLERLQTSDPAAAAALAQEFRRHDFAQVYAGIVRPFGLATNDAADALTAYTVLGWLIATGAPDPAPPAVRAVRDQLAARMASTPQFRDEDARRDLGEELTISFVTLHAGWQAARREGTLPAYADGVAALFLRTGTDLRALRLSDQGLARR